MPDGGWHEVDRVRSRIGTTSDAIRGINLDEEQRRIILIVHHILFLMDILQGTGLEEIIGEIYMMRIHLMKTDITLLPTLILLCMMQKMIMIRIMRTVDMNNTI